MPCPGGTAHTHAPDENWQDAAAWTATATGMFVTSVCFLLLQYVTVPSVLQGQHVRFDEQGVAQESPTSGCTVLQGVPPPQATHMRFDD